MDTTASYPRSIAVDVFTSLLKKIGEEFTSLYEENSAELQSKKSSVEEQEATTDIFVNFPRSESWYSEGIAALASISGESPLPVIEMALALLPSRSNAFVKMLGLKQQPEEATFCSFDSFLSYVPSFSLEPVKKADMVQFELLLCAAELFAVDALACVLQYYRPDNVPREVIEKLENLAFVGRDSKAKKLDEHLWNTLREEITAQWALVLSRLSIHNFREIVLLFVSLVKPGPKLKVSEHDVSVYYRAVRYLKIRVGTETEVEAVRNYLTEHIGLFDIYKKTPHRVSQLEVLEYVLTQIDFAANPQASALAPLVEQIFGLCEKWSKEDAIREACYRILCLITTRSEERFFEEKIETLLSKKLLKNLFVEKKKDTALESMLNVLRGTYIPNDFGWDPERPQAPRTITLPSGDSIPDPTSPGTVYGCETRSGEDSTRRVARLGKMFTELFAGKGVPKLSSSVPILTDILVQMAAQDIDFVVTRVLPLLLSEKQQYPEYHIIALKAMRIILDPSSGFQLHAGSAPHNAKDTTFQERIDGLGYALAQDIHRLFKICVKHAGSDSISHAAGEVAEFLPYAPYPLQEAEVDAAGDKTEGRGGEEKEGAAFVLSKWRRQSRKRAASVRTLPLTVSHEEDEQAADSKLQAALSQWGGSSTSLATAGGRARSSSSLSHPKKAAQPTKGNKTMKRKILPPLEAAYLDALRELVQLLPHSLTAPLLSYDATQLAMLLMHDDEELAMLTSLALQQIVHGSHEYRPYVIRGMLSLLDADSLSKLSSSSTQTIVRNFIGSLKWWIVVLHRSAKGASLTTHRPWLVEAEAVAALFLCDASLVYRKMGLELMQALADFVQVMQAAEKTMLESSSSGNAAGNGGNGASMRMGSGEEAGDSRDDSPFAAVILAQEQKDIFQRARYQFLVEGSGGVAGCVSLSHDTPSLSLEEVAAAGSELWTYVL